MPTKQELRSTFRGKCGAEEDSSRDHVWYVFRVGHEAYATTKVSHGRGDISNRVAGRIARQIGLTQRELGDLVACRLSAANFHASLVANGPFTGQFL